MAKTFEEFQATRKFYPCLIKAAANNESNGNLRDYVEDMDPEREHPGLTYDDFYVVEVVTNDWPEQCQAEGLYYLMIFNQQYITNDLEFLERELFECFKEEMS